MPNMEEKHMRFIIHNSLLDKGCYSVLLKDMPKKKRQRLPYDGYSVINNFGFFAWESKLLTSKKAFNFNDISDDQWKEMKALHKKEGWKKAVFPLGYWDGKQLEVLFLSYDFIREKRSEGKPSLYWVEISDLMKDSSWIAEGKLTADFSRLRLPFIDKYYEVLQ